MTNKIDLFHDNSKVLMQSNYITWIVFSRFSKSSTNNSFKLFDRQINNQAEKKKGVRFKSKIKMNAFQLLSFEMQVSIRA